ncbi:MAG: Cof-type HAD-IIB family hydrolase [Clostridia bacterium]|nr:Cof-type HAD-IIB family hydrolase [Clostridia bacterium]MBQ9514312.1 Cof-type HAD-IIB family hydrolase [Clostridia bacterium]
MKYDLMVSDFDGTLGTVPDVIDDETVDAIKKYTGRGGKFAIVTGRVNSSIMAICRKYNLDGIVISYQGSMIKDVKTDETLFVGGIGIDDAIEIVKKFQQEKVKVIIEVDDMLIYNEPSDYIEVYKKRLNGNVIYKKDLCAFIKEYGKIIQKINVNCTAEQSKTLTDKLNAEYKGKIIFNNGSPYIIEAINPSCSKGQAVRYLSRYYNIPYDKIIAVGDSTNDIELINGEWHGVCVGDGREELKKIADEITVPYKDKPIKTLLEKYQMI